jgi:hypothetical protein
MAIQLLKIARHHRILMILCGGGVEYLHQGPVGCRGDEKGSLQI